MTRSILAIALFSSLVLAHDGPHTTEAHPDNLEDFPWISNDLSSYDTSAFLSDFPTGTLEPIYPTDSVVYPTGTAEPVPTGGYPTDEPYPSPPGSSEYPPMPLPSHTGDPGYGVPSEPITTYPPAPTIETSYGAPVPVPEVTEPAGNATVPPVDTVPTAQPTFDSGANTFTVKLPVVLGALGLVFAML